MMLNMLKCKIHRATITGSDLNYEGSITIDRGLLEMAGILPNEKVDVLNINNGERFTTYAIEGKSRSGDVIINGAAARLVQKGDLVIICAFASMSEEEAKKHTPVILHVDAQNKVTHG